MAEGSSHRARRAYEWGRARDALLFASPLLVVAGLVLAFASRNSTLPLGVSLYVVSAVFLWRGGDLARAVFPGVVTGLIPLSFALCARASGHACMGGACVSLCIPACGAGGLLAGIGIAMTSRMVAKRGQWGASYWAGAASLATLTGALGCSCVGYSGIAGVVAGLVVTLVPSYRIAQRV